MRTRGSKGRRWPWLMASAGFGMHVAGCGGSVSGESHQPSGERDGAIDGDVGAGGSATGTGGSSVIGSGGVSSNGGASGHGGAGGVAASGGSPGAGGAMPLDAGVEGGGFVFDGGTCFPCFGRTDLSWGMNGGLVAFVDVSSLSPCLTYTHRRDPTRTTPPSLECTTTLQGCPDDTVSNVLHLLSDPTFNRALVNDVVYGVDSRPVDGQLFRITVGQHYIDVGSDCAGASGCLTAPPQVKLLVEYLQGLDAEGLRSSDCVAVFGAPL